MVKLLASTLNKKYHIDNFAVSMLLKEIKNDLL